MKTKPEVQADVAGEPLISQEKAAELCGMTRAAINNMVRRGRLNSIEVEGRHLIYYKEVEALEAETR
jgi:biotin operon repressor